MRTNPAAQLVTSVAEMVELLTGDGAAEVFDSHEDDSVTRVFDALNSKPTSVESIAQRSGLSVHDATSALGILAASGRAINIDGSGWSR
jgi:predicted Rossmann fold nucleotide-binding protein DprA/Smf involved in DNA uptake